MTGKGSPSPQQQAPLALAGRNPDVLTCIANLSNDEVFTPPELANEMLDNLERAWADSHDGENLWANSSVRFLDPFTKSGVFLREITKRLVTGLGEEIPDLEDRVDHILTKQVYGIAITELTAMLARRSLYCSKWADGEHSIAKSFAAPDGNIWFEPAEHIWVGGRKVLTADKTGKQISKVKDGRCKFCGTAQSAFDRGGDLESHAYAFIHTSDIEARVAELFGGDMQFDVIVGNPPYQLDDDGGHRPVPIYQKFVTQAKALQPRFLVMVTPSRWMAGGLGLSEFRSEMLSDRHVRSIVDFPISKDVFHGVEIKGGVSYFVRDGQSAGKCAFYSVRDGITSGPFEIDLDQYDVLVRDPIGLAILDKVVKATQVSFESLVSSVRPFGDKLRSNFSDYRSNENKTYSTPILVNEGGRRVEAWTKPVYITANSELASNWKVFLPKAGGDGGQRLPNRVLGSPRLGRPGQVSTETYLAIGPFSTKVQAENALKYLTTRFARYLISLRKPSHDNVSSTFRWVPNLDWSKSADDQLLMNRYGLTVGEQDHIRTMVTEWSADDV